MNQITSTGRSSTTPTAGSRGQPGEWAGSSGLDAVEHDDVDASCRGLVARDWASRMASLLRPAELRRRAAAIDSRALCLMRETWPGTTASPISRSRCRDWAPARLRWPAPRSRRRASCRRSRAARRSPRSPCRPDAGSDVAAMTTRLGATAMSGCSEGEKTWISNGGIADFYCVFARSDGPDRTDLGGARHLGLHCRMRRPRAADRERIEVIAPHPLARLRFEGCRVRQPTPRRPGQGFKIAMRTLDVFRISVAAAALGFARRAFDEGLRPREHPRHVRRRTRGSSAHPGTARADGHDY